MSIVRYIVIDVSLCNGSTQEILFHSLKIVNKHGSLQLMDSLHKTNVQLQFSLEN